MAALCVAAVLAAGGDGRVYPRAQPLFLEGACPRPDGGIVALPSGAAPADAECAPTWTARSAAGTNDPVAQLAADALRDLHTLTPQVAGAAPAVRLAYAGWSPNWRYVWPRDAAFVATAFARSGNSAAAIEIYRFLASHQLPDGSFAARYRPDGTPPDDRTAQFESVGWYLWGLAELGRSMEPAERAGLWEEFAESITAAAGALFAGTKDGLPAPSSDYWEREERRLTLSTAAMTLAGLEALADLDQWADRTRVIVDADDEDLAERARARAAAVTDALVAAFGPDYGRYGRATPPDAALAFCLPPFQPAPLPGALEAWRASLPRQYVPASGGYAPGASWKDDGVSWTPETTLHAWVAAENGREDLAREILAWTASHTTSVGSIPEKVTAGGRPSAVAPLTWSAANVVLAYDALASSNSETVTNR